jgi:hypothetical protein
VSVTGNYGPGALFEPANSEECSLYEQYPNVLWYSYTASSNGCLSVELQSSMNGIVAINKGFDCTELQCVQQVEGNGNYKVEWMAEESETYYVVIAVSDFGSTASLKSR